MDSAYTQHEFNDLRLIEAQTPIVTETYPTMDDLLNESPMSQPGNYANIPNNNQYQQPDSLSFYKYEPMLINHDLREVSEAELTPDSTGHIGYTIMNSDNEKIPSPYEIPNHDNIIIPGNPANPGRNASEQISDTVSPNIIKLYNVPATKNFETGDTSTKPVNFNNHWKVDKEIMSQIHHQSSLPKNKSKKNCGKVSSSKKSQKTCKTKETVPSKFNSSKEKPIILKSSPKTPSVNISTKYNILKSLVHSLEDLDNVLITKQEKVHSKEMKTNNIMFNLSVEVARLAQEDHRRIIALCDPGKLKPSKL